MKLLLVILKSIISNIVSMGADFMIMIFIISLMDSFVYDIPNINTNLKDYPGTSCFMMVFVALYFIVLIYHDIEDNRELWRKNK